MLLFFPLLSDALVLITRRELKNILCFQNQASQCVLPIDEFTVLFKKVSNPWRVCYLEQSFSVRRQAPGGLSALARNLRGHPVCRSVASPCPLLITSMNSPVSRSLSPPLSHPFLPSSSPPLWNRNSSVLISAIAFTDSACCISGTLMRRLANELGLPCGDH